MSKGRYVSISKGMFKKHTGCYVHGKRSRNEPEARYVSISKGRYVSISKGRYVSIRKGMYVSISTGRYVSISKGRFKKYTGS